MSRPAEEACVGPELVLEGAMETPRSIAIAAGVAAVFSSPSPSKETPNEDAAALLPVDARRAVLAVADGVGGMPEGERAARVAVEALRDAIAERGERPLREAILDGFERANAAVIALRNGAATTLVVAELDGITVRSYHAGDSGLMVVGGRGAVRLQTVDHSPVAYAVEAGMLDAREAIHHADRHLISNVIGREDMRVDVGPAVNLRPRDLLLLASDGLFDNLRGDEIAQRARRGPPQAVLAQLVADCQRRMRSEREGVPSKPDDLTLVAFRLLSPPRQAQRDGSQPSS